MGLSRATYYRYNKADKIKQVNKPRSNIRKLSNNRRKEILNLMDGDEFIDMSPREIYAALLDRGVYHCSISTMYRILRENNQVKERRRNHKRNNYNKPELLATAPNQVWTWDITKLKGAVKFEYFHLYLIIDIYSRYVVGWLIANHESGELAKQLIQETCEMQNIPVDKSNLTIHSDRGSAMKSQNVSRLLAQLNINKSFGRPHVSNDNPFSESQFKTLKYHYSFPERFGCYEDAETFCQNFITWYNQKHYHNGIGLLTPESVHYNKAKQILNQRNEVLQRAYEQSPERFVKGPPKKLDQHTAVWINPPQAFPQKPTPDTEFKHAGVGLEP